MRASTVAGYRIEVKFCYERGAYFARVKSPDGLQLLSEQVDAVDLDGAWKFAVGCARADALWAFKAAE